MSRKKRLLVAAISLVIIAMAVAGVWLYIEMTKPEPEPAEQIQLLSGVVHEATDDVLDIMADDAHLYRFILDRETVISDPAEAGQIVPNEVVIVGYVGEPVRVDDAHEDTDVDSGMPPVAQTVRILDEQIPFIVSGVLSNVTSANITITTQDATPTDYVFVYDTRTEITAPNTLEVLDELATSEVATATDKLIVGTVVDITFYGVYRGDNHADSLEIIGLPDEDTVYWQTLVLASAPTDSTLTGRALNGEMSAYVLDANTTMPEGLQVNDVVKVAHHALGGLEKITVALEVELIRTYTPQHPIGERGTHEQ